MKRLLAINGSTHSAAALEEVASRHWPLGRKREILTIVHSTTPLLLDPVRHGRRLCRPKQELRKRAPALLDATAARLTRAHPNLAITTKALTGTPRELIVQEAADWRADLIVLGSHGHGSLR